MHKLYIFSGIHLMKERRKKKIKLYIGRACFQNIEHFFISPQPAEMNCLGISGNPNGHMSGRSLIYKMKFKNLKTS